ncbi:ArsR/SmtB family transcription factor [Tabrizicola flagellatus]|uniref:ArsR/SmtB family transcription factor n=1 Tax=Tabrizicola flagellatus TaxID=2593021 RepID=UPI001F4151F9|nr:metalloregulator ArsR/SmtB family transcription factor [Tabrizicola flagellatus]
MTGRKICFDISGNIELGAVMDTNLAAARLAALGSPTRLRLYRLLVRAGEPGQTMGQIQEQLGIPGSTLSHHCRALVQVGLIRQQRVGTSLICHANYPVMRALIEHLAAECCAGASGAGDRSPE